MNIEPYPVKTNDYKIVDKGKSYFDTYKTGYKDGEEKTIEKMLEIIDGYKSKATEPTKLSASTYNILLDRMKRDIYLALKGGTDAGN